LADLFGNGRLEVIVASQNGYVYALNGDASLVPGWPKFSYYGRVVAPNFPVGFLSSPVVGDLFGNGQQEIVAASLDHFLYAWDANGNLLPGFPIALWDTTVDTPLLVDLYNNGQLDIVVGGDSAPSGHPHQGVWYAFPPTGCSSPNASNPSVSPNGCALPGWPRFVNDTPWSSPAAGNTLGDGVSRIVTGTGHYYAQTYHCACGEQVNGFNADGSATNGWPQPTPSQNFGSVAVGNLLNNGHQQVVAESENNRLYAFDGSGTPIAGWPESASYPVSDLGSPAIAPVDGSGNNGVWAPSGGATFGFDAHGNLVDIVNFNNLAGNQQGSYLAYGTPTITTIQDPRCPGLCLVQTFSNSAFNAWYLAVVPIPNTTSLTTQAWNTFHGNMQRSGQQVPIASVTSSSSSSPSATTDFTVNWALDSGSVPATSYTLWVWQPSVGWTDYANTSSTSQKFTGLPGDTYAFFVDAHSQLGSADQVKYAQLWMSISGSAHHSTALPFNGMYGVDEYGQLEPYSSPLVGTTAYYAQTNLMRGIAVAQGGQSGQIVDAFGGIHPFGFAPGPSSLSGYWPGRDIARGIALLPGHNASGYVLDLYGGISPFGGAPPISVAPSSYYPGRDLARGIALLPSGTGGYVLDAYGGLHPFGTAPPLSVSAYWPGWDIARGIALLPNGTGGYVLDGFGGVHAFGSAIGVNVSTYWPGWDIARGIALTANGQGYVADGYGGIHPFGGAPDVDTPRYTSGSNILKGISLA
jgi:hypothetical protein